MNSTLIFYKFELKRETWCSIKNMYMYIYIYSNEKRKFRITLDLQIKDKNLDNCPV